MKKYLTMALSAITFFAIEANAAFVDTYSVNNWQKSLEGGFVNTKSAPDSIKINSNNGLNSGFSGERNMDFTVASLKGGFVTFDWSYKTNDKNGAGADPFGILLNGIFTQLTDNSGGKTQSGTFSFRVRPGDIFGFRANSVDSLLGIATTTISNFSAPSQVPAPAALWLMTIPVLSLARKKRLKTMA